MLRVLFPVNCRFLTVSARTVAITRTCSSADKNSLVTHTGQDFDKDDYRNVRFVDRIKTVNPNFAIDFINKVPPKECSSRVVSCDGGGGALGHPKVYINLDQPGNHSCGYCGLRFFKKHH